MKLLEEKNKQLNQFENANTTLPFGEKCRLRLETQHLVKSPQTAANNSSTSKHNISQMKVVHVAKVNRLRYSPSSHSSVTVNA